MNRDELDKAVAARLRDSKVVGHDAVDAVIGVIAAAVAGGEEVRLGGFGIFAAATRGARAGRNPRTGAAIEIAEKRTVKFHAAKQFKDAVENGRNADDEAAE